MKIGFVKYDCTVYDGSGRVMESLMEGLGGRHSFVLIGLVGKGTERVYGQEDLPYYAIAETKEGFSFLKPKFRRAIEDIVKKEGIGLLVGIGISTSWPMAAAAKRCGIPSVTCEHNSIYLRKDDPVIGFFRRRTVALTDRVVLLTDGCRRAYAKESPRSAGKMRVIYNWLPEEAVRTQGYDLSAKKLLTVARPDKAKGLEYLIETASMIRESADGWTWEIWGDTSEAPEYVRELKALAQEKGVDGFVRFCGYTEDAYSLYPAASVVVMTSRNEGFGLALLEGRANRVPLVSFDCDFGPSEIVEDGVNGFLIPCFDTGAMAEAITKLIRDPKMRQRFSDACAEGMEVFSKTDILRQWEELLTELQDQYAIH